MTHERLTELSRMADEARDVADQQERFEGFVSQGKIREAVNFLLSSRVPSSRWLNRWNYEPEENTVRQIKELLDIDIRNRATKLRKEFKEAK